MLKTFLINHIINFIFLTMKKVFTLIAMLLPMLAMAQTQKEDAVVGSEVSTFQTAAMLSRYGYANKDALSLIQAARIITREGYTLKSLEKVTEGGKADAKDVKKHGRVNLNVATLLKDARQFAGNDGALLALIDDAAKGGTRGAVPGPQYDEDNVSAYGTVRYTIRFRGGEIARVVVSGDGDTDLDLYVYDENGNLITSDTDYTDQCVCTFSPRWTGPFIIKIVNRGRVYNHYVLATN